MGDSKQQECKKETEELLCCHNTITGEDRYPDENSDCSRTKRPIFDPIDNLIRSDMFDENMNKLPATAARTPSASGSVRTIKAETANGADMTRQNSSATVPESLSPVDSLHKTALEQPPLPNTTALPPQGSVPDIALQTSSDGAAVESFDCPKCDRVFTSNVFLQKHITKMHVIAGTKRYGCATCKKLFKRKQQLMDHLSLHTGERPYECVVCGKTFSQKSNMYSHKKIHSDAKPYKCKHCSKAFKHSCARVVHIRTMHDNLKPFKCETCGKCFAQSGYLNIHSRTHTKQKPYKCNICGQELGYKNSYNYHMKSHQGDKQHKCQTCGKAFVLATSLHYHEMKHSGEYPVRCEVCGKGFPLLEKLNRHMKAHDNEIDRPFECLECDKRFTRTDGRRRHMRNVHGIN